MCLGGRCFLCVLLSFLLPCGWGVHKSLMPRTHTLLGVLGQATLNFVELWLLLFLVFCECPRFCDLAKQRHKTFLGVTESGKNYFPFKFSGCTCFSWFLLFLSAAVPRRRLVPPWDSGRGNNKTATARGTETNPDAFPTHGLQWPASDYSTSNKPSRQRPSPNRTEYSTQNTEYSDLPQQPAPRHDDPDRILRQQPKKKKRRPFPDTSSASAAPAAKVPSPGLRVHLPQLGHVQNLLLKISGDPRKRITHSQMMPAPHQIELPQITDLPE